jgi:hypothetical protein
MSAIRDMLRASFDGAAAAEGSVDRCFTVAGHTIRLRFAGKALPPRLTPALVHLASHSTAAGEASLTVLIWEAPRARVRAPASSDAQGLQMRYRSEDWRFVLHEVDSALNLLDTDGGIAFHRVADAAQLPPSEMASPLKPILNWWTATRHLGLVHAAAVGTRDGGVLLAGRGGSGKSTTALVCVRAGFDYVGDDYVVVRSDPPFAHSLYNSARLTWEQSARIPELLRGTITGPSHDKTLAFIHELLPERISTSLPIRAILLPQVTGRTETRLCRTTAARALLALAPSTLFQVPGNAAAVFRQLVRLVDAVPAFVLELGTDLDAIPVAIRRLLDGEPA